MARNPGQHGHRARASAQIRDVDSVDGVQFVRENTLKI